MAWDKLVKLLQLIGAALAIPAAAAGSYSAYRTYFSSDVTCAKLRSSIMETMEKRVAAEIKRSLLHKDVADFLKDCGENDPDTRSIFQAALAEPALSSQGSGGRAMAHDAGKQPGAGMPQGPRAEIFGSAGSDEHGWVALGHRETNVWVANFSGSGVSETSLPPPGSILTAQRMLPVWSEPQGMTNDPAKMQSRLRPSTCVRVLATRLGPNRRWAEVAPASCS
jgi:hypothetical protein